MSVFQLFLAFRLKCKFKNTGTSLVVTSLEHCKSLRHAWVLGYFKVLPSREQLVSRITLLTAPSLLPQA